MFTISSRLAAAVGLVIATAVSVCAASALPPNQCVVDGTVTYQDGPCPSDRVRKSPTLQELNAEERRRRAAAEAAEAAQRASAAPPAASSFRCDGRRTCPQMTSCAEAKFFLAHCPRTKMDGDHNGIPCELQWCGR